MDDRSAIAIINSIPVLQAATSTSGNHSGSTCKKRKAVASCAGSRKGCTTNVRRTTTTSVDSHRPSRDKCFLAGVSLASPSAEAQRQATLVYEARTRAILEALDNCTVENVMRVSPLFLGEDNKPALIGKNGIDGKPLTLFDIFTEAARMDAAVRELCMTATKEWPLFVCHAKDKPTDMTLFNPTLHVNVGDIVLMSMIGDICDQRKWELARVRRVHTARGHKLIDVVYVLPSRIKSKLPKSGPDACKSAGWGAFSS